MINERVLSKIKDRQRNKQEQNKADDRLGLFSVRTTGYASHRKNVLVAARCKPILPNRRLPPVTRNPNPTTRAMHPMSTNPNCGDARRSGPRTRNPNVTGSGPAPVTWRPNVTRSRRNRFSFNAYRRRCLRHIDITPHRFGDDRTCRSNFASHGRLCCHRRFVRAPNQCEWRQGQYPNACFHNAPFCIISFLVRRVGLIQIHRQCCTSSLRRSEISATSHCARSKS